MVEDGRCQILSDYRKGIWIVHYVINCIMMVIIVILLCINHSNEIIVECVPTQNEAIEISKIICNKAYPDIDFNQYEWKCIENQKEGTWIVFYHKEGQIGGLPEVHIRKDTAEVIFISLMS